MKNTSSLFIGILISMISLNLNAQQKPDSGAALIASENAVEVEIGQLIEITLERARSKSYTRARFGSVKINAPGDFETTLKSNESDKDQFIISLKASEDTKPGKYIITIQGEGRNAAKVKGTMLSVTVKEKDKLAKSKQ